MAHFCLDSQLQEVDKPEDLLGGEAIARPFHFHHLHATTMKTESHEL
jgi:hypothetical protein